MLPVKVLSALDVEGGIVAVQEGKLPSNDVDVEGALQLLPVDMKTLSVAQTTLKGAVLKVLLCETTLDVTGKVTWVKLLKSHKLLIRRWYCATGALDAEGKAVLW